MDVQATVDQTDRALRAGGTPERARQGRAYLKTSPDHYGASVPANPLHRQGDRGPAARHPSPVGRA